MNRVRKGEGVAIDFFDRDMGAGGIRFPQMSKGRKGEGAAIDFFAGDRMVRGVRFPKMSEGRKVGWPLHPSPAGRVGAYRIRPTLYPVS